LACGGRNRHEPRRPIRLCLRDLAGLLCCPFCRELFTEQDAVTRCPDCGVDLLPLHAVPPSPESQLEQDILTDQTPLEYRTWPFWNMQRGKGWLLLCALLGLASYALPWFSQTQPETRVLTGFQLARHYVGWLWGGAIGWFILIPLVLTRRTIVAMRGVRMISVAFASMTALEVLVFVNATASRQNHVIVQFAWEWGIWISSFVSAIGACVAVTYGGQLPEKPAIEESSGARQASLAKSPRKRNRILH
jgi:hypothetical protein